MVLDEEELLRRVRADWASYKDGAWRLGSQSFNDVNMKPSVNRALTCGNAENSKVDASDGIVKLIAGEIRNVGGIVHNTADPPAVPRVTYKLDVLHRPIEKDNPEGLPENPSHAQIESDPTVVSRTRFDKIKEALVRLASQRAWVIEPSQTT